MIKARSTASTIHPIHWTTDTITESLGSVLSSYCSASLKTAVLFTGPRQDGPKPAFVPKPKVNWKKADKTLKDLDAFC